MMRRLAAVAGLTILAAGPASADPKGSWRATSNTALAVTGDIALRGDTLIFGNGTMLRLTGMESRDGRWTPLPESGRGTVYRLSPPSDPVLLNGNALCGKPVTYLVLSQRAEHGLSLTAFTGKAAPDGFGADACAVYFYER
jgi:hypothetical protein